MAHDFTDLERRKAKAKAIASRLRCDGVTPEVAVALARDTKWMRATERAAGVSRSSDATWSLAMQDLARRPPVLEHDRRTGCRCTADPDTGALYEFPGWPCPHGTDDHPGPVDPDAIRALAGGFDAEGRAHSEPVTLPPLILEDHEMPTAPGMPRLSLPSVDPAIPAVIADGPTPANVALAEELAALALPTPAAPGLDVAPAAATADALPDDDSWADL